MDETDTTLRNFKDQVGKPRNVEIEDLKDTVQKLRNLQAERKSLLFEIDELKKMADAKAADLESEVSAMRNEVESLRILMYESEQSLNKRKSSEFQSRAEELRKMAIRDR